MHLLMISTARNILNSESRDRERMRQYANQVAQLHIIVFSLQDDNDEKEIHDGNLHIYPTHSRSRKAILFDAFRIGKRVAQEDRQEPLIVSAQDPLWTGWLAWLLTREKNTALHIQLHGDYFGDGWSRGSLKRKLAQKSIMFLLRRTPNIRVVSERIRRSLTSRGIETKRITVLPIRPELERFLERTHTPRKDSPLRLLFVGRFAPEKDVERILKAFAQVYQKRTDITLHLVGKGGLQEEYTAFIKKHRLEEVVIIDEWTEDIPDVMANADVFLLASKHEAYGLVLLEAMASGLPVITTDVGCVGEVVKDGVHGIVVKDEGVDAYAAAIETLLNDVSHLRLYGAHGKTTAEEIARQSMDAYVHAWVNSMSLPKSNV